jgi:hypothetical protein
VVRGVLGCIVRIGLENIDQHADVLEDHRALGGRQVRVYERVLTAVVPEVEDRVIRAVECKPSASHHQPGEVE